MRVTPYLNFDGNCAEAFAFYADLLGGTVDAMTHEGTPMADELPPEWHGRIMHACLKAGDVELMASDSPPGRHQAAQGSYVSLHVDGVADAERIYAALAEGGAVQMPLEKTFWAARFGMVVDRFGTPWMINCEKGD